MKKIIYTILTAIFMLASPTFALAKEKLYVINSGSTGGSFNAIMSAYVAELKDKYDVTYVQAKGCTKTKQILEKVQGSKAFYISQGIKAALDPKCDSFVPTAENIVHSHVKFGMLFARKGAVLDLKAGNIKIAYNSTPNKVWLEKMESALSAKSPNTHVLYKNSTAVVLAVLNGETDLGYVNTTPKVFKNKDKLAGVYSLNPEGDSGVPPLNSLVKFEGSEYGQVDNFLTQGFNEQELAEFRKQILDIHNTDNNLSAYFKKAQGTSVTISLPKEKAVEIAQHYVNIWRN